MVSFTKIAVFQLAAYSITWFSKEEIAEKLVDITTNYQIELTAGPFWHSMGRIYSTGWHKTPNREYDVDNETPALFGIEQLKNLNWQRTRVFQSFEFVAKDIIISYSLVHLSYMGNLMIVDISNYKDETAETYSYPIPKEIFGEPNYKEMNWDLDIDMKHGSWAMKVKDSLKEDLSYRKFTFSDTKLGMEAEFSIKREKYMFAGYYLLTGASENETCWWHQDRNFGLDCHGSLKYKGKETNFNKVNRGRFNYLHLAGNASFKSGQVTAVISALTDEKRKLNFFTTTGLSDNLERNRANADVLFIDDARTLMEPFTIEYDRKDFMKPWKVETYNIELFKNKKGELVFTPWGQTQDKLDYYFVKRDFNRISGFWSGYLVDEDGKKYEFTRAQGYVTFNYVQA